MKDTVVRARVSSDLKEDAEKVLAALGISTTEAIRMFLSQVRHRGGLPFEVRLPVWSVFRQDDSGNEYLMQDKLFEEDAKEMVREFEARAHKQTYWCRNTLVR